MSTQDTTLPPLPVEHIEQIAQWLGSQRTSSPATGPEFAAAFRLYCPTIAAQAQQASHKLASVWADAYRLGVIDERTSEANIGIAGFGAKVEPARANPFANSGAQQAQGVPEGYKLVAVNSGFDDLMYWLNRCDEKGHLENCADLIEPWSNFDYRPFAAAFQSESIPSYRHDFPNSEKVLRSENEKARQDERLFGTGFTVNGWHVPASKVASWGMKNAAAPQAEPQQAVKAGKAWQCHKCTGNGLTHATFCPLYDQAKARAAMTAPQAEPAKQLLGIPARSLPPDCLVVPVTQAEPQAPESAQRAEWVGISLSERLDNLMHAAKWDSDEVPQLKTGLIRDIERCAQTIAASAEPQPEREPLSSKQKRAMWVDATIEACSHENCYLRGIADAEQAHGIGTKGVK